MKQEVDFSAHVKEVLNRNNIQIKSLALLKEEVKHLYFHQRKKAILLLRNKVFEREIDAANDTSIDVFDTQLIPYLKKGQLLLLVLPTETKVRYVLQATVESLYVDRFRLKFLDPRKNRRYPVAHGTAIQLRTMKDATALRIQSEEVRTVRSVNGIAMEDEGGVGTYAATGALHNPAGLDCHEKGDQKTAPENSAGVLPDANENDDETRKNGGFHASIEDMIVEAKEDSEAHDNKVLKSFEPVKGYVADVSLGGVCLVLPEAHEQFFPDGLVALETTLIAEAADQKHSAMLKLFLFAVIRNISQCNGGCRINLQFFSRLPLAAEYFFPEPSGAI